MLNFLKKNRLKFRTLISKSNVINLTLRSLPNAFKMRFKAFQWKRGNTFSSVVRYHVLPSDVTMLSLVFAISIDSMAFRKFYGGSNQVV